MLFLRATGKKCDGVGTGAIDCFYSIAIQRGVWEGMLDIPTGFEPATAANY